MPSIQRGDVTTYYEESGQGEPLVLICGLSADLQYWRFQVPALSKHYRVICFDNRGAGRSSAPDHAHSLPELVDDVVALLEHLEIDSAHVLGHSMGGQIAQLLAVSHPKRVKRLVLVGSYRGAGRAGTHRNQKLDGHSTLGHAVGAGGSLCVPLELWS